MYNAESFILCCIDSAHEGVVHLMKVLLLSKCYLTAVYQGRIHFMCNKVLCPFEFCIDSVISCVLLLDEGVVVELLSQSLSLSLSGQSLSFSLRVSL